MFKSQMEYNQFYDRIKRYGLGIARRFYLSSDAVDNALDYMVDKLLEMPDEAVENVDSFAQKIIHNYLKNEHRDTTIGTPNVRILELPPGKKRDICMMYWIGGMTQKAIANELNVKQPYVSKVLWEYGTKK